jgi:hypothetical protein
MPKAAHSRRLSLRRAVALGQGLYFLTTGIWPILHIRSFMAVTGPKQDLWLVKTVGAIIGAFGAVLTASAAKGEPSKDLETASIAQSAALAAVDVVFVAQRRIAPIYLLDAVGEALLIAGWMLTRRGRVLESKPRARAKR